MANFTEYFSDYLSSYNLPSILDVMPEDDSGITFKQRFIDRNYYKEIGSETEELFTMHLAIKCQECVNKYLWKINSYIDKRDEFLERVVSLSHEETKTDSGTDTKKTSGTNTTENSGTDESGHNEYYNPVNGSSDNITGKNTDSVTYGRKVTETPDLAEGTTYGKVTEVKGKEDRLMYFSKSYPELMKLTIDLENLYEEALAYLDILFMTIL